MIIDSLEHCLFFHDVSTIIRQDQGCKSILHSSETLPKIKLRLDWLFSDGEHPTSFEIVVHIMKGRQVCKVELTFYTFELQRR